MKDYRRFLLDSLLEKYETSKHYYLPGTSNRPVSLQFTPANIPDYFFDSSADYRNAIHQACEQLVGMGFIRLHWAPLAKNLEIRRVDLCLEALDRAYRESGRVPRRVYEDRFSQVAGKWLEKWKGHAQSSRGRGSLGWLAVFAEMAQRAARKSQALPVGFNPKEAGVFDEVCMILDAIANLEDEIPHRVLSLQVLGDSKRFDRIRPKVIRALREFSPSWKYYAEEGPDVFLEELGVVEHPQLIRVSGSLVLSTENGEIDTTLFEPDVGLPPATIRRGQVKGLRATRVVTVENLTSYYVYVRLADEDTLAVYLGGYANRGRRLFLEKLRDFGGGVLQFHHWGDIDLGGFQIFNHLKNACSLPLNPLYMDRETFERNLEKARPFDDRYGNRLRSLLDRSDYEVFHDLILVMLEHGKCLEQEGVDPDLRCRHKADAK